MKSKLLNVLQFYWRWKFSKKAIVGRNVTFGRHTKIILSNGSVRSDIIINDNARVFGTLHASGGKIYIGRDVHFGPFSLIGATEEVYIDDLAMISTRVDIIDNNNHPVHPKDRKLMNLNGGNPIIKTWKFSDKSKIVIGRNTWLGKNSLVLKGVRVNDDSIVAANSVVTKNVPKNSIVAGNPAKLVKSNISEMPRYFNE